MAHIWSFSLPVDLPWANLVRVWLIVQFGSETSNTVMGILNSDYASDIGTMFELLTLNCSQLDLIILTIIL